MNDKSGLEKMEEWLEEQLKIVKNEAGKNSDYVIALNRAFNKARSLLAKEQLIKPPADEGIAEILKEQHHYSWVRSNESLLLIQREQGETRMANHFEECLINAIERARSRHKPQGPLAELADRKGWDCQSTGPAFGPQFKEAWNIFMSNPMAQTREFNGKTYAEAESKARKYLEGLPDMGERK